MEKLKILFVKQAIEEYCKDHHSTLYWLAAPHIQDIVTLTLRVANEYDELMKSSNKS